MKGWLDRLFDEYVHIILFVGLRVFGTIGCAAPACPGEIHLSFDPGWATIIMSWG